MKKLMTVLSRLFDTARWREIETAPSDRELELAVIDSEVRPIGVFCLRHENDWLDAETLRPIKVTATHWRLRWPAVFPLSCC